MVKFIWLICIILFLEAVSTQDLVVITVATEANDGYLRFINFANQSDLEVETFGMNKEWKGGDMEKPGGGHKILLLKEGLKKYENDESTILMFSDSYDAVILQSKEEILYKFEKFKSPIVFGAEDFCWPDKALRNVYPKVGAKEKRFLNSGGFIGYAKNIVQMINAQPVTETDDDQLYYTNIFLDKELNNKVGPVKLDHRVELFQNLNGAKDEVDVRFTANRGDGYLFNTRLGSKPAVVHANGPTKIALNSMANYLGKEAYSDLDKCRNCDQYPFKIDLKSDSDETSNPKILISIFIDQPTPFLEEFFQRIINLTYPKKRIDLSIHCAVEHHEKEAKDFKFNNVDKYNKIYYFGPTDYKDAIDARNGAYNLCLIQSCDFWFYLESFVQLTNRNTLSHLIEQNRTIISPMVTQIGTLWSTFWGDINDDGYYKRSDDYAEIAENVKRGIWNVPLIRNVYLMRRDVISNGEFPYSNGPFKDIEMDFALFWRNKVQFMYVDNQHYYGHLVQTDGFPTTHLHNELWSIFNNPTDWEARYVHENYSTALEPDVLLNDIPQPCPDVFWVPLLSDRFCKELIEEMEHFGEWSNGENNDPRLEGGYENVPTRDIHMRQIDWEGHWLHYLRKYVHPLQKKFYAGYDDIPTARMNFVVRYRPDEQPFLVPHHDASSYTLNIALNRPNIDYQGGGARFIRYNCSVIESRLGWALFHPGRVTHIHEGLRTTNGTRYIFVVFINP